MVGVWIARITSSCSCILQRPSNRTPGWSCRLHRYAQILKNLWRWDAKMRAAPSTFQIFSKHIHTTRLTTSGHKRLELAFPSCFQRTFLDFKVAFQVRYHTKATIHHPKFSVMLGISVQLSRRLVMLTWVTWGGASAFAKEASNDDDVSLCFYIQIILHAFCGEDIVWKVQF